MSVLITPYGEEKNVTPKDGVAFSVTELQDLVDGYIGVETTERGMLVYDENGKKTANARFTVVHNGVVIHDDIELSGPTPGRSNEEDTHHGLYLQGHGNRVQYRNIWVQYK